MEFRRQLSCVKRWTELTLGLVLPPSCAHCGDALDTDAVQPQICAACRPLFTPWQRACDRCGAIFQSEHFRKCRDCDRRRFAFDDVTSLGPYEGVLGDAILRMKYDAGQSLAFALGRHLAQQLECAGRSDLYDLVVCATKYWLKLLFTGINSPEVIMQGIANEANLPHAADLLVCRRRINKQSLLSPDQRRRNVRNAWTVSRNYDVTGTRILLVDDILTTGATAHEMARALKQAGAKRVSVAVVGRATKWQ